MKSLKRYMPVLVCLLFSVTVQAQTNTKNDLTKDKLKGKVKAMINLTYLQKARKPEDKNDTLPPKREAYYKTFTLYNESGNKLEYINFGRKGDVVEKDTFLYNKKGNPVEDSIYFPIAKRITKFTYRYDTTGKLIEMISSFGVDTLDGRTVYEYNANGIKTGQRRYYTNGKLSGTGVYNAHGDLTEQKEYRANGQLKNKRITTYDAMENVARSFTYNGNDSLMESHIYRYDDKGNEVEQHMSITGEHGGSQVITHRYDKFDNTGNWIIRTTNVEGRPVEYVNERLIVYY